MRSDFRLQFHRRPPPPMRAAPAGPHCGSATQKTIPGSPPPPNTSVTLKSPPPAPPPPPAAPPPPPPPAAAAPKSAPPVSGAATPAVRTLQPPGAVAPPHPSATTPAEAWVPGGPKKEEAKNEEAEDDAPQIEVVEEVEMSIPTRCSMPASESGEGPSHEGGRAAQRSARRRAEEDHDAVEERTRRPRPTRSTTSSSRARRVRRVPAGRATPGAEADGAREEPSVSDKDAVARRTRRRSADQGARRSAEAIPSPPIRSCSA